MHVYYPEVAVEGHFDTCDFGEVAAAWLNQQGGTIWGIRRREPMAAACATPALWS
jgi:hypothetical protein